jgi:hypothetical protein
VEATQRLDPHLRESALQTLREWLKKDEPQRGAPAAQIFPTELALAIAYIPGMKNAHSSRILHGDINNWQSSW